jgi:hypothetical protein
LLVAGQCGGFIVAFQRVRDCFGGVIDAFAGDRVDEASSVARRQQMLGRLSLCLEASAVASGFPVTVRLPDAPYQRSFASKNAFSLWIHNYVT